MSEKEQIEQQSSMIFSDNTNSLIREFQEHTSKLDPFCKDILDIGMTLWYLNITDHSIIFEHFNKLIDIFDKLHGKEDEESIQLKEVLQDFLVQNLRFLHLALEIACSEQNAQEKDCFKQSIPLIKKAIGIVAKFHDFPEMDRMIKLVEELGYGIDTGFSSVHAEMVAQRIKNHDVEEIMEEIIEKVHYSQTIIGYSKQLDETISNYETLLEKKKKKHRIFWNIAMSIAGGLALIGLGSKMRK